MSNRSVEGHLRGFALLGVGRFSRTWTGLANPATLVRNTALRPQGHKVILETAFEWFIVVIQDAVKFCWTLEAKCHLRLHLFQLRGSQHEFLSSCWMERCGYCSHESRPNCCSSQQRDQSWRWQRFVSAIEELAEMNGRHTLLGSESPPATAAAAVKAAAEKGRTPFPQNSASSR